MLMSLSGPVSQTIKNGFKILTVVALTCEDPVFLFHLALSLLFSGELLYASDCTSYI